jgi:toluene monooxygenase electron transfer component
MATVRLAGSEVAFDQAANDSILRAALRAGIGIPYECNAGGCGSCKFELIEGELETLWTDAPGLTERDRRRGRHLACQSRAKGPCVIKTRISEACVPKHRPARVEAVLVATADITHDIREFRFRAEAPARFLPGQYALLYLPGFHAARAYSMSNGPNGEGEWHIQIRRVPNGQATAYLFEQLAVGERVSVDGPYGLAHLRPDSPRDIVCIGGGSGLAPMVSVARGAAAAGMLEQRKLHFFYGGRTHRDICSERFLRELPGFGERIFSYPSISMPQADGAGEWAGRTGYIHEVVRSVLDPQFADFEFYLAGPPPMTQAVQQMLMIDYRVPFEQIHYDRFF